MGNRSVTGNIFTCLTLTDHASQHRAAIASVSAMEPGMSNVLAMHSGSLGSFSIRIQLRRSVSTGCLITAIGEVIKLWQTRDSDKVQDPHTSPCIHG